MTLRPALLLVFGLAVLVAVPLLAQHPAEPAADPLPPGALVRFGTTRPILRTGPAVALIPPKFTNFLAPTMTGGMKRYDLGTGRPLQKNGIVGPGQVIVCADGKRAAVALPGGIKIFEVASGKELLAVKPPEGVVLAGVPGVSLSADGRILAFAGKGLDFRGEVVVLDIDQNEVLAQCTTSQAAPVYVTLSRDGKTLVSYGPPMPAPTLTPAPKPKILQEIDPIETDDARTAQVWEVASGRELFKARVTGMGGNVVSAALSPNADFLAVSAGDGPIDVFDMKTGERRHTLLGRKTQGVRVAISPDGKMIASIGIDYRIERWQSDGKRIDITEPPGGLLVAAITALEFADNERVIASQTAAQFAYAWDAPAGKLLSPNMDHAHALRSIAFPAGGKDLFTSGNEGKAFRWNLTTGGLGEEIAFRPARIPGQPLIRPTVNLSADGTRAVWPRPPSAEVFDVATGDNLYVLPPPSSSPATVTYSASRDGMRIACLSRQGAGKRAGNCVIWDLTTEKRVLEFETLPLASGSGQVVTFSPDGNRAVLIAFAHRPNGAPLLTLIGYDLKTSKKLSVVEDFNASGTITFGAVNDTTVVAYSAAGRLWTVDYVDGQLGDDFDNIDTKGDSVPHAPVAVSADGKRFAVSVNGEPYTTYGIRVYDTATKKALGTFIGHLGPVSAIQFSPDGNSVASGAQDTSVLLWDLSKAAKAP